MRPLMDRRTPHMKSERKVEASRKQPSAKNEPVNAELLTEEQIRAMPEADYMNAAQLDFFRRRLEAMRSELLARAQAARQSLIGNETMADPTDRATAEEERFISQRLSERETTLLRKVEDSLRRIRDGSYGYCEKSGEPIGIPRLLARPTATVSVDVKDLDDQQQAHFAR
jgi:DnaK suppressor protein